MTWGWKLAIDLDDVVQFLNGSGTHHRPIGDARICSLWKGNHTEYYIFYRCDRLPIAASAWGWKRATDPDDVCSFLSGSGRYRHPVKDAQIAALRDGNHTEFNVLYQSPALQERVCANWGWKLATDPSDVMNFLNGAADYRHPVTTARIAALEKDGHEQFYLFYQRAAEGDPIDNWSWKLATEADDALNFVNGQGAYHKGVKGFQAVALRQGSTPRFYLFANQGTRIWPQSPLENERTVLGEPVRLTALVTGDRPLDGDALAWVSSLDGALGYGSTLMTNALSPGTHEIWVEGYGADAFTPLRVFTSLDDLYEASPSPAEMARIDREFALHWIDGAASDE